MRRTQICTFSTANLRELENCKFAENYICKLGDPQPTCKFALRIRVRTYFPQHYPLPSLYLCVPPVVHTQQLRVQVLIGDKTRKAWFSHFWWHKSLRLLSMFEVAPLLAHDSLPSTSFPREVPHDSVRSKSDVPTNAS